MGIEEPLQVCDLVFNEFDADGSGAVDYSEYMLKMLRDALARDRTRILDLFRQWDKDSSGAVDRDEFREGIRRAGFDAKEDDLDAIFDDLDEDGSGELEYNELQAKLQWWASSGVRASRRWRGAGVVTSGTSTGYYDL